MNQKKFILWTGVLMVGGLVAFCINVHGEHEAIWNVQMRVRQRENLLAIAGAIKEYQDEHQGEYPKDLQVLLQGNKPYLTDSNVLQNPLATSHKLIDYFYSPPTPLTDANLQIMAFSLKDDDPRHDRIVLFADDDVVTYPEYSFKELLQLSVNANIAGKMANNR